MQAVTSPSLVGRQADLEWLGEALDDSLRGSTRAVLVGGEAGIGKTRLVNEFVSRLSDPTIVLRGQSVDLDRDAPPYAPIVAVLRALAREVGDDALLEASGPAADTLRVLVPELGGLDEDRDSTRRGGAERLYDAVAGMLENIARSRPLVVVIEDVQWADQATLGILRFLVRVIEHSRILFVVTFRSDELGRGSALRAWLPELDRNRRVSRRELARLSRAQAWEMATAILGSPPDDQELSVVYERTEGVPFFIEEFIGCESFVNLDSFPETLRGILLARYEVLSDTTQRIMRLLAAGGACVEHKLLVLVCDDSADDIDSAAREAVAASVLVIQGTAYAFRHALVREAIHELLLPGERVRFHTRYAQALESRQGELSTDATAISYHWMAAHNTQNAFSASIAAMGQARNSYAFSTAARMGERAIELWDQVPDAERLAGRTRVELLADTSYILRNAGESDRAIALIDEAISTSDPAELEPAAVEPGAVELRARMLRDKASYLANVGQVGSITLLRQALEVLGTEPRSDVRANILGELAARLMLEARFDQAVETANAAYAEAVAVDSKPRMSVAANIRGTSRLSLGEIDEALDDLAMAGELAAGHDSARLRYWVNYSDAMNLIGRYEDAVRAAEEGAERARLRGVERTSGVMLMANVIGPLFALGQTRRADELLDRALELDAPIGFSAFLRRLKLQSTLWSGDSALAERMLRGWRSSLILQSRIDAQARSGLAAVGAEIALARGNVGDAWTEARIIFGPDHRVYPAYDLPLLAIAARVLAAARSTGMSLVDGEFDDVESRLRAAIARLSTWPTAPVYAAVVAAELGGHRHTGTDPDLWSLAVTASSATTAPAQFAPYAAFRLAQAFAGVADRSSARLWSQTARVAAEKIGLGLVVAQIVELEHRVGMATAGLSKTGGETEEQAVDAGSIETLLTVRERQVLELIAQGLSNRQVAERLFISVKTASVHVSNILRKTGATSRTEAAYFARDLGGAHTRPVESA